MPKTYTWRNWKARPRTFGGKKYRMVFQGCVTDFKKAEMQRRIALIRSGGHLARLTKKRTHRGMEWVIYEH